eukprot:186406_1
MATLATTCLLIVFSHLYYIVDSYPCSQQYTNCNASLECLTEMSTLGGCVSAADNDPQWTCTPACRLSLAKYFNLSAPGWIPDETLESCECDPDSVNDTSCEYGKELLIAAGCARQFVFPKPQDCVITQAQSDTIYVSSLGSDNATTCGAMNCPCGTIGYAFFLATNGYAFTDGSHNHFFDSKSITIHIDGVNPEDLWSKQNSRKCGIYVYYQDSQHQGTIDPMFGVGTLDTKENITFNFAYVRRYLGHVLRVRERQDWYPCGHEYCSPAENDMYMYCDNNQWSDIFRLPDGNGQTMAFDDLHQIDIHITGLVWDNIFRKKGRGALIQFGGDTRITTHITDARIDNIYVDTSQKGLIIGQSIQIKDSVFENIVLFNEATGDDVIFDNINADQYLFGDLFYATSTPHIQWVQGFSFIRTKFRQITQYDEDARFLVMSDARQRHQAMQRVFDKVNVSTQSIDVDLSIIALPM